MNNKRFYLKIAGILLASFAIVNFGSNEIFVAGTPQIRTDLTQHLAVRFQQLKNPTQYASLFDKKTPEEKLQNLPLELVTKGVYAKSDEKASYTVVKQGEVEWVEHIF